MRVDDVEGNHLLGFESNSKAWRATAGNPAVHAPPHDQATAAAASSAASSSSAAAAATGPDHDRTDARPSSTWTNHDCSAALYVAAHVECESKTYKQVIVFELQARSSR
jgi:hypothetical protein